MRTGNTLDVASDIAYVISPYVLNTDKLARLEIVVLTVLNCLFGVEHVHGLQPRLGGQIWISHAPLFTSCGTRPHLCPAHSLCTGTQSLLAACGLLSEYQALEGRAEQLAVQRCHVKTRWRKYGATEGVL